jgi:hypothetical protein
MLIYLLTLYGKKYVVQGELIGPTGKKAKIITIWVIEEGEPIPRFVTAYPA